MVAWAAWSRIERDRARGSAGGSDFVDIARDRCRISTWCATRAWRHRTTCRSSNSRVPLHPARAARSASRSPMKWPWTSRRAARSRPATRNEPYIGHGNQDQHDEISEVRVFDEQPVHGPQLVLAWPKEAERRIVTMRLVPQREPRFGGRALRQAFASAGFWHGPLDIYHLPDSRGRVIVSAAALAQPGTFDPSIMDSQRFSGLNLFSVLPGVLSERDTFDELVRAARMLAERARRFHHRPARRGTDAPAHLASAPVAGRSRPGARSGRGLIHGGIGGCRAGRAVAR